VAGCGCAGTTLRCRGSIRLRVLPGVGAQVGCASGPAWTHSGARPLAAAGCTAACRLACHTLPVTVISSFSAAGAIRHHTFGSPM
jgi:hypothetical protein